MLEKKEERYENGNLKAIWYEDELGRKQGKFLEYYFNKNLMIETYYKNGKLHGEYKHYDLFQKLKTELTYKEGEAEGTYKEYHEDGTLKEIGQYVAGKREGEWKKYYNGLNSSALEGRENYRNDKLEGECITFYPSGKIMSKGNYKDGKLHGEYKSLYENGNIREDINFSYGEFHEKYRLYHENGELSRKWQYINGIAEGISETYLLGGIVLKNQYSNNELVKYWHENKEGKLHGEYISFFTNGEVKEIGRYVDGKREGEWKFCNKEGKLEKIIEYVNNEVKKQIQQKVRSRTRRNEGNEI